jgi:protein TonB
MRSSLYAALVASLVASVAASAQATQVASNGPGPGQGDTYFEFQVEKPVALRPGNPHPSYPESMRSAAKDGRVTAQFVVDTNGRVDVGTFQVLESTNESFTKSVREVLPQLRFFPAEEGGRRVKQLVQQDFRFAFRN